MNAMGGVSKGMMIKSSRKGITVIILLGLMLGGVTYGVHTTNTISRFQDQLQSENITGMHWYSFNGTGLQNCTDNVLGLGRVELEVYAVEGTGDITCPHEVETVLEGMTQTLTGLKSGDIVILNFDCTMIETAIEKGIITFRIKVDGVQIGKYTDVIHYGDSGRYSVPISFMRRYEVPGDGDYTFTVTWYWTDPFGTPQWPPECNDGLRTLTILHISG